MELSLISLVSSISSVIIILSQRVTLNFLELPTYSQMLTPIYLLYIMLKILEM